MSTSTANERAQHYTEIASLPIEIVTTVQTRAQYDSVTGDLRLIHDLPSGVSGENAPSVLGRWDRDVVDSGALVRRLPLGQVVVEVDSTDRAVESSVRRMLALGKLVREDVPWGVYGGQRFRAVRVVTD